jgi:hypothetical protein
MAHFTKGGGDRTPFGKNAFLRSTRDVKTDSGTLAAATVANETIDGIVQKVLQSGELLAKITSGPDIGKFGPFQAGATDGRADAANIVGLNDTFLPWQTAERDVEVGYVYEATLIQSWCFERNAAGARIPLSNATVTALVTAAPKGVRLNFR